MQHLQCKMLIFGSPWDAAGPMLGPSWGHLGPSSALFGLSWTILGSSWVILGPFWNHVRATLDHLALIFGPMAQDGPKVVPRWPNMAPRWPQYGPKRGPRILPKIGGHFFNIDFRRFSKTMKTHWRCLIFGLLRVWKSLFEFRAHSFLGPLC